MLLLSFATTVLLSNVAMAAPASANTVATRQTYPSVPLTFNGAAGAFYNMLVVANDTSVPTNNDLSIMSISIEGHADYVCHAYGVDGSSTQLVGQQNVPVGPPQPQVSVECSAPPESR